MAQVMSAAKLSKTSLGLGSAVGEDWKRRKKISQRNQPSGNFFHI